MKAYARIMSMKKLFAVLVALAVLFAPGVTGAAMAADPHHGTAVMEAGHCEAPPSSSDHHDQADGKSCCMSMCMAVAVAPLAPAESGAPRRQIAEFAPPRTYRGLPAEIATPPPRRS